MSEQLRNLSQSIVEIAKEIDGLVVSYGKHTAMRTRPRSWVVDWRSTGFRSKRGNWTSCSTSCARRKSEETASAEHFMCSGSHPAVALKRR